MTLVDDLHRVLSHFHRQHLPTLVNQGAAAAVESHLAQLAAVAGDVQHGDAEAMKVISELYGAPANTAAAADPTPAAEPTVAIVDEHGPEPTNLPPGTVIANPTPAAPEPAPVVDEPAPQPADTSAAAAAVDEPPAAPVVEHDQAPVDAAPVDGPEQGVEPQGSGAA